MNHSISRKNFISQSLLLASGIGVLPKILFNQEPEKPKPIAPDVVKEFVKVAHSDFNKVNQMLEEYPLLLNASWDWGGGDHETAIGAAGHMGLKETANFLLEKGARADIFVMTMLGKTEIVKSMLKDYPALINAAGPHGFTLLHHAQKGGKESEELYNHLQVLGLKETFIKLF